MSSLQIRVCGRYRLEDKLYQGRYYTIFSGKNVQSDTDCAIKSELKNIKTSFILNQGKVLQQIQGGVGIPNLLWYGQNGDFNFVITQLLGTSLEDYFDICGGKFSLKTVLMIADKLLSSIEFIHYKNFLHRDLQPNNFVMGLGKKLNQIYTIDYSLATPYMDQNTNKHRQDTMSNSDSFVGSPRFSSLNTLQGHRHSRRDDLESIGLILIYFLKGRLPWDVAESNLSVKQRRKQIRKIMQQTSLQQLLLGLPKQLFIYMQYVRGLKYEENPDYSFVKRIFKQKLIKQGYQYDNIFDWILIPLKLKDTKISNRVPINRIAKTYNNQPDRCNLQGSIKQDIQFYEEMLKKKKMPKQVKKQQIKNNIQDTRMNRSISTNVPAKTQAPVKRGKQDCEIY